MTGQPSQITFDEWDARYEELIRSGIKEASYGGPLRRHVEEGGDLRLLRLRYDNSAASLRLWNFLLTEEDRLHKARAEGKKIIGTMKDLGTVPVMAYSIPDVVAFYPDGAWWIPCVMEQSDGLLGIADSLGIDESFCPVRAVLGAFITEAHFPIPDLITCSVGATCDDLSAIVQRLNGLGYPVFWWEIPARRRPDPDEEAIVLPGGFIAPVSQVEFVKEEMRRLQSAFEALTGSTLDDDMLSAGIRTANRVRESLGELRRLVYTSDICPLPALEMLIAEMLAIHFCSDRDETLEVYDDLIDEVKRRLSAGQGILSGDGVRVYWVNPVADLRTMNLLEELGGRICGTEYLFSHALDQIPEDIPPMDAIAQMALADPMVGSAYDRASRICRDIVEFGAEVVIISRIPGASHCATEGAIIKDAVQAELGLPVVEIEVPPVIDSMMPSLITRIEAILERGRERRK
ncbi:MAG: 2-hydroxyacyl-CoA dehydratase [Armatimonadota bacterium]